MGIEFEILDFIQSIRTPFGDVVMPWISALGNGGFIWILLVGILLVIPKTRRSGMVLAAALCLDVILCDGILKHLVARTRPCDISTSIQLLIRRPRDYSFPSGHTAASITSVTALYFAGERRLWKAALVLACFIMFSRLYLYVHYPTDILGGIVIGITAGYGGYRITGMLQSVPKRFGRF